MSKVLITGGAGFIGSFLAYKLVANGDQVVIVDDLSMGKLENIADIKDQVTFYEHTVCDEVFMHNLLTQGKFDYIYYLAAVSSVADSVAHPWYTHQVNQESMVNTLEYIRVHHLPVKSKMLV